VNVWLYKGSHVFEAVDNKGRYFEAFFLESNLIPLDTSNYKLENLNIEPHICDTG
jgi:hypothetical protein